LDKKIASFRPAFCRTSGAIFYKLNWRLGAGHFDRGRAFFAFHDFKGDGIADLQLVKSHALQLFGMEKKILGFAFARNESESPLRERFDNSVHVSVFWLPD